MYIYLIMCVKMVSVNVIAIFVPYGKGGIQANV